MNKKSETVKHHATLIALLVFGWFVSATAQDLEQSTEEKIEIEIEEVNVIDKGAPTPDQQEQESIPEPSIRGTTESDSPPGEAVEFLINI
jgi:hypothetical protein